MSSSTGEQWTERLDALRSAVAGVLELDSVLLTTPERLNCLDAIENVRRVLPAVEHPLINELGHALPEEVGGRLGMALADRLRITPGAASRRLKEAEALGPRATLTGETLEPQLPATATGQKAGEVGPGHVSVIRSFLRHLPTWVAAEVRQRAEADLAALAASLRPDELEVAGRAIADAINPDGVFDDGYRARKRGVTVGRQGCDGMTPIKGWLTPEARATWDAVMGKLAKPGMCHPDDEHPTVDGEAPEEATTRDHRSTAQRTHDGLLAALRGLLAAGTLGRLHGLPVTVVATATVQDLEQAAGVAHTGGGSKLPMRDLIRMASQAHHYLAIFDQHTNIPLYLAKTRIATPGQRLVLFASQRGCTKPGCTAPFYDSEVHHDDAWSKTNRTDVTALTLACPPDHDLTETGLPTRKRADGVTEWIPPPHLDTGKPRTNGYWHPQRYQRRSEDDDPE